MESLTVSSSNPRYFADPAGRIIYLTGSHTWNNFQEVGRDENSKFDYSGYLNFMAANHHNFMRLWTWEQSAWISSVEGKVFFGPQPYERTGPGYALDGKPKFSLTKFNQSYFDRLRSRVLAARNKGIYVSVMLFQGFSIDTKSVHKDTVLSKVIRSTSLKILCGLKDKQSNNPWKGHPFNARNNINGIDGDPHSWCDGREVHTLNLPQITKLQEEYVKKIIDTLNDLDNVMWEISNESNNESTAWQYHMIDFIHNYEKAKGKWHPVLMTAQWPGGVNATLFNSSAEAVSPIDENVYKDNPPAADGSKVIIIDTDHLWGIGGDHKWVWRSFLRGMNPIFMDPYKIEEFQNHPTKPEWELIRNNLGYTRQYAGKVDLVKMRPLGHLSSTGYCLANSSGFKAEYLVYLPSDRTATLDLAGASGTLFVEWFNPATGNTVSGDMTKGGAKRHFTVPFNGDAVLFIHGKK